MESAVMFLSSLMRLRNKWVRYERGTKRIRARCECDMSRVRSRNEGCMSEVRKRYDRCQTDVRAGCERDTNEVGSRYERLRARYERLRARYEQGTTTGRVKYETSEIQLHEGRARNECETRKVPVWRKRDTSESTKRGTREERREKWLENKVRVSERGTTEIRWRLSETQAREVRIRVNERYKLRTTYIVVIDIINLNKSQIRNERNIRKQTNLFNWYYWTKLICVKRWNLGQSDIDFEVCSRILPPGNESN